MNEVKNIKKNKSNSTKLYLVTINTKNNELKFEGNLLKTKLHLGRPSKMWIIDFFTVHSRLLMFFNGIPRYYKKIIGRPYFKYNYCIRILLKRLIF